MNGNEVYDAQNESLIDNVFSNNVIYKKWLKGFYNYLGNMSKASAYRYLCHVSNFLAYTKGNPSRYTLDDYTDYLTSVKDKTASYQIVVYSALKKFSTYLYASRKSTDNPMQFVSRPKFRESVKTKKKREIGYLTPEEIQIYLQRVETGLKWTNIMYKDDYKQWRALRDKVIILILLNTGLRCSAVFKLNIDSVDFKNKSLITVDKGDKIQEYELDDGLCDLLKEWISVRKEICKNQDENALFLSFAMERLGQQGIANIVKKYSIDINGKNITPHKLRATYGTELYRQTKDLYFVQTCMGHSNPKTTEMYIRGESKSSRKKASAIMSNITMKK